MNSKDKGKTGERELKTILEHLLRVEVHRTGHLQGSGGHVVADVTIPSLPLYIECKRCQKLSMPKWMEKAQEDCPKNKMPIVAWRQNHKDWNVNMTLEHFVLLMNLTDKDSLIAQLENNQ